MRPYPSCICTHSGHITASGIHTYSNNNSLSNNRDCVDFDETPWVGCELDDLNRRRWLVVTEILTPDTIERILIAEIGDKAIGSILASPRDTRLTLRWRVIVCFGPPNDQNS